MDSVISESCYTGTILQRNYRKMTILWSFPYNSFVKFQVKHNMTVLYPNLCSNEVCYKGTALYFVCLHRNLEDRYQYLLVVNLVRESQLLCKFEHIKA